MSRMMLTALIGAGLMLSAADAGAQTTAPARNDYAKADTWLCRPDKAKDNACAVDLSTTVVKADGTETLEAFKADPSRGIPAKKVFAEIRSSSRARKKARV